MRKIKFRADDGLKWIYSMTVDYDKDTDTYYMLDNTSHDNWIMCGNVGQYIGIKDKDGAEIYEGDFVEIEVKECALDGETEEHRKIFGSIEWNHGGFDIKVGTAHGASVYDTYTQEIKLSSDIISDEWKVVGNIYENPELLEESAWQNN